VAGIAPAGSPVSPVTESLLPAAADNGVATAMDDIQEESLPSLMLLKAIYQMQLLEAIDSEQDEKNSILVSSHITSDMEKFADYITYIHDGGIVFSESKDALMDDYGILKCAKDDFGRLAAEDVLGYRQSRFGCEVLVRNKRVMERKYRGFALDHTNIEEIMLFYAKGDLH
jgi:ABC-2 type transport system ATP-binding protein